MQKIETILVVEDNEGDFILLQEIIESGEFAMAQLIHASTLKQAKLLIETKKPSLVFLDLLLPDANGLNALHDLQQLIPASPVIILSGMNDLQLALEALQAGAMDYLVKGDINEHMLIRSVQYSIERKKGELALHESENRLRTILNTDPECIKLLGSGCELYEINKAGLEMIEANVFEEIKGHSILEIVMPAYRIKTAAMVQEAFEGKSGMMEFEMLTFKGTHRWCEINIVPYLNAEGKITNALGVTRDISARKNKEEELKRSEAVRELIMNSALDGIICIDLNEIIFSWNPMAEQIFGWKEAEVIGKKLSSLVVPHQHLSKHHAGFANYRSSGHSHIINNIRHLPALRSSGEEFMAELVVREIKNGTEIFLCTYVRDVTERLHTEEDLKQSHNRFLRITSTTSDAVWEWDLNSGRLWCNETHQQLYGLTLQDPVPSSNEWAERIHPDEREQIIKMQEEALLSDTNIFISEYRFRTAKGYRSIFDRCYISRDEKNKPVLMTGSMMDVTERKLTVEALLQSEEKYRTLVEQANDGILIADHTGRFVVVNPAAEKLSQYSAEELAQLTIYDIADKEELQTKPFRFEEMKSEQGAKSERKLKRKDGSVIDIEINTKFLSDGRFLAFIRDITERKKAEEEINNSYRAIRKLTSHLQNAREEERIHIAREIHDELGQQLTVLKMDISWLNKKIKALDQPALVEKTEQVLQMLNDTVNSVRRISADLRPGLLDDLGLAAAIEWHLIEFGKRSGTKTDFITHETTVEIPQALGTGLFRIYQESITNIARHAEATEVIVELFIEENGIAMSITDNGKGFDVSSIGHKKTLGVLGMQERTVMMGGEFRIQRNHDKGMKVEVNVPLKQDDISDII